MNRRNVFGLFLLPLLKAMGAVHSVSTRLTDGSWVSSQTRFQNGYLVQSSLRVAADGASIMQFELTVAARRDATVEGLLRAAGLEIEIKTNFVSAVGVLVTKVEDVEGDFHILIDGTLFLSGSIGTAIVKPGQKVLLRALTGARLAAK